MRYVLLAGLFVLTGVGRLLADGLADRLPPDGTWVKYKITVQKYQEWDLREDKKEGWVLEKKPALTAKELAEEVDFLLVRLVGKQDVDREPCRWVELVLNAGEEGKKEPESRVIVLKLLIPEKAFGPGLDLFNHVKKMYMSDRRDGKHTVSEVTDADRRKYEVERFRLYFPVPPKAAKRGGEMERKTPAGAFKGTELAFVYGFDGRLGAGKSGWNYVKGSYTVMVSDRAPFGIAAVLGRDVTCVEEYGADAESGSDALRGTRLKQSWTMEVAETGTGAKSGLPDKN